MLDQTLSYGPLQSIKNPVIGDHLPLLEPVDGTGEKHFSQDFMVGVDFSNIILTPKEGNVTHLHKEIIVIPV